MLTPKKIRFADEYMVDQNATAAAKRSGYSLKTAYAQGHRLLKDAEVQQYIKEKQAELAKKLTYTREDIARRLSLIAMADVKKLYEDDKKTFKDITALDEETAASIAGIEVDELWGFDGEAGKAPIGVTKKIKRWDPVRAAEALNKMQGWNEPEKHQHELGTNFVDFLMQSSAGKTKR